LGTVATGVWNGTAIGIAYGGTGQATASAGFNALSPITTTGDLIIGNGTNSATRLPIGLNSYVLTSNGTTATWAASGSGGSGTVNSGTQYQLGYYASTGTAISGNSNIKTDANSNLNLAATSATLNSANTFGFKNRIINGGMVIDQRNAGASITPTNMQFPLDRWSIYTTLTSKISTQQLSSSPPTGFVNYLGATVIATATLGASDYFSIRQYIEGFNTSDFAWGTANAKSATLSFWVYSNLTGTFGGSLSNNGSTCYPFSYSIPTANTWTQISITVTGPTSGTFNTNNSCGILLCLSAGTGTTYSGTAGAWGSTFYMSATGATSIMGTVGNYLYITGVQLEVGTQATSFDFRDYGRELILCQRYFNLLADGRVNTISLIANVSANSTTTIIGAFFFPVRMRTTPTLVTTVASYRANLSTSDANSTNTPTFGFGSTISGRYDQDGFTGLVLGGAGIVRLNTDSGYIAMSAEL
jgi:hypothetical protein